ncbi:MAG: hypothetical protein HWE21_05575 [Cytophagia bacterium]|nr:hypothetical protein [Cytophagia bacterium]NVK83769.1 hypothetical protein [Cytophagia bacterium]
MKKLFLSAILSLAIFSCASDSGEAEFTGNEVAFQMIPGSVNGNETSGSLVIRERTGGIAQIEIRLNGVIANANHPVHLHFGSLEDDGNVATLLNPVVEVDGIGQSVTILNQLENGEEIDYAKLIAFDGSIKVHFEASGPLKDEILGSTNIGINSDQNQAYLSGDKSITICNSEY